MKFFEAKIDFNAAEWDCRSKYKGWLATAETETKNTFLKGVLGEAGRLCASLENIMFTK